MNGEEMNAREVMDAMTARFVEGDLDAVANLYASDAIAVTPEQGEVHGRDEIIEYLQQFRVAFPNASSELAAAYETGDCAIDEGYFVGTNTGPLLMPDGTVPATGRDIRLRVCDLVTVEDNAITRHRFYYDQLEFLEQLGLVTDPL